MTYCGVWEQKEGRREENKRVCEPHWKKLSDHLIASKQPEVPLNDLWVPKKK